MKYQAKPVIVDAHRIVSVGNIGDSGERDVALGNGTDAIATAEMCSRYTPKPGDYWVVQDDGYVYLNPKEVFERKYELLDA